MVFNETDINKKVGRTTAFTFLFWVDPENVNVSTSLLFTFMRSIRVAGAVSPLHDMDINEVDSVTGEVEYKKPHYHCVIDFGSGNNKTVKQCFDLIDPIRDYISIAPFDKLFNFDDLSIINDSLGSFLPDKDKDYFDNVCQLWKSSNCVRSMRSLLRYFLHLDNPEKAQYFGKEITSFGGFDLDDRLYSQSDSYRILDDIFDFIEAENYYSFWQLLKFCRKNNREWFSVICKNQYSTLIINALKSYTFEVTGALDKKIDKYSD